MKNTPGLSSPPWFVQTGTLGGFNVCQGLYWFHRGPKSCLAAVDLGREEGVMCVGGWVGGGGESCRLLCSWSFLVVLTVWQKSIHLHRTCVAPFWHEHDPGG